jgi:hypothetical protein
MKKLTIILCTVFSVFNSFAQNINLSKIKIQSNSDLFKVDTIDNQATLIFEGNVFEASIDSFTGMEKSNSRGAKVFLIGEKQTDYVITAEMKFVNINLDNCNGCGWFGFAIRAQDFDNFEAVWFMPRMDKNNVAYVPVAHGIAPYWTEAYKKSEKGTVKMPHNDWFEARAVVEGKDISIFVNNKLVLKKKASYYLTSGYAGFFVGTATDAAFRNVKIETISQSSF